MKRDRLQNKIFILALSVLLVSICVFLFILDTSLAWGRAKIVGCVIVNMWLFFLIPALRRFYLFNHTKTLAEWFKIGYDFGAGSVGAFLYFLLAPVYGTLYYFDFKKREDSLEDGISPQNPAATEAWLNEEIEGKFGLEDLAAAFLRVGKTPILGAREEMFLFEAGTFDRTGERLFSIVLSKQFRMADDNYRQLQLWISFSPNEKNAKLSASVWKENQKSFAKFLATGKVFRAMKQEPVHRVEVHMDLI